MIRQFLLRATKTARRSLVCGALLATAAGAVQAQTPGGADFQSIAQDWLRDATTAQATGAGVLRMDVKVGSLDSRLKLAPCGNVEPYLPPGTKLWGRTRVGLRCVDGLSRWNVSLPVTVNAYGTAWVIKGQVALGATLTEDDVVEAEVNWAEESSPVLSGWSTGPRIGPGGGISSFCRRASLVRGGCGTGCQGAHGKRSGLIWHGAGYKNSQN